MSEEIIAAAETTPFRKPVTLTIQPTANKIVSRIIPISARSAAFLRVMVGVWRFRCDLQALGSLFWNYRFTYEAAPAAFCAVSFGAVFATGLVFFAAALRTAAHRLRVASTIALRPAALSLRFAFAG